MKVKLKQMKKTKAREHLDLLKQQVYKDGYNIKVRNKYGFLNTEETTATRARIYREQVEKYQK